MLATQLRGGILALVLIGATRAMGAGITPAGYIEDVYTDRARYAPGETVAVTVELVNATRHDLSGAILVLSGTHLDAAAGEIRAHLDLGRGERRRAVLHWSPPPLDFRGYLVEVRLMDAAGQELDRAFTAVDVSSDWRRFPRYAYLAWFGPGVDTEAWVGELCKFHLNGLQFYDFQYKHHQPLAGTAAAPWEEWRDIAGRTTRRSTILGFLRAARTRRMTTMAYNASYGAYADAFHDGSGVRLEWAAWPDASGPRTEETVKSFGPLPAGWATPRLLLMNQNHREWQDYLFARMADLFAAYPFDGWHIDTYGDRGAYAYDGTFLDYTAGFRPFADRAREILGRRVVLNTVAGRGQTEMALSKADFVYTELWEDTCPTYQDILDCADEIHAINAEAGIVFPAYQHRGLSMRLGPEDRRFFNVPAVLLLDAVIFAAGAHHLELGDGGRMLSHEYFVNDEKILVSPELRAALRRYYDFLVAYQNLLRDRVRPGRADVTLAGVPASERGEAGAVWTVARAREGWTIVHLINLLGARGQAWRDEEATFPEAPGRRNLRVRLRLERPAASVGWASPDYDGGKYQPLRFKEGKDGEGRYVEFTLPHLKYWDMVLVREG